MIQHKAYAFCWSLASGIAVGVYKLLSQVQFSLPYLPKSWEKQVESAGAWAVMSFFLVGTFSALGMAHLRSVAALRREVNQIRIDMGNHNSGLREDFSDYQEQIIAMVSTFLTHLAGRKLPQAPAPKKRGQAKAEADL